MSYRGVDVGLCVGRKGIRSSPRDDVGRCRDTRRGNLVNEVQYINEGNYVSTLQITNCSIHLCLTFSTLVPPIVEGKGRLKIRGKIPL